MQEVQEAVAAKPAVDVASFDEYSKQRAEGKVEDTGEKMDATGKHWNGSAWVNRDERGRFAKVRENLERAREAGDYIRGIHDGTIPPTDDMDGDTWRAAREAQLRNGSDKITVPDFGPSKPAEGTPKAAAEEAPLTPEQEKHFESHETFKAKLCARMVTDPKMQVATTGFQVAADHMGVPREAIDYLGHVLADTDNGYEIFLALGDNPDAIAMLARLHPLEMQRSILQLSREMSQQQQQDPKKPKTAAPPPPDPVGARATATAFDVNDDKMSSEEWSRKRTEQRRKAGHTF